MNRAERQSLLTSQLLSRYHFLGDKQSLDEFHRRMNACKISKEKAEALIASESEIVSRLNKRFLFEPGFIKSWFFSFDKPNLKEDPKDYLTDREFTISEISKIFDEANWHSHNSLMKKELSDAVRREIYRFSARGEDPILNVAVTTLTLLGWSMQEAHRYLYNEKLLIDRVRWGYETAQEPFAPEVDHPASAKKVSTEPGKREIRGKRLVFLILAIFCGFFTFVGLMVLFTDEPTVGLVFVIFYGLPFALFLWLFLRKGKEKHKSEAMCKPAAKQGGSGEKSVPPVVREQHKSNTNVEIVKQMIDLTQKRHAEEVAAVENDAVYLNDGELLKIFAEYFSPNTTFFMEIGSPKFKAYFEVINAATLEMLNNPKLYNQATKREQADLVAMCNNRIPGITNSLICGLIFSVGKYAVVPSSLLCVDFADVIPNCIAVYLLLTAQKLPADNRKQAISVGDGVNKVAFEKAMETLRVCDPNWDYSILQAKPESASKSGTGSPAKPDAPEPTKRETPIQTKHGDECCSFSSITANKALMGASFEEIEVLGGGDGEGYSWNDGSKALCRCRKCGALFLSYRIKFLAMTYEQNEVRYSYYLPVGSRSEALEIADKYIGSAGLADSYKGKKIWFDNKKWNLRK